ncbi:MAG: energy-coupling factor ABC transporter permease [Desulfuromonadales bacterium]
MHMADALLSPAVGGTLWAVSAGTIAYCSKKIRTEADERRIPRMGILGAFIFAAQMINFTIPITGSSGHLGGGLILSILLGPYAAFLTIASVLVVQALFFADGGLLALGCNIFNLGFCPAFIAYPLVYKNIVGSAPSSAKITIASMTAAIIGLQMGAFWVVLETTASGISALPFWTFMLMMQPIHLAIGVVEGLVTASIVSFIYKANPSILQYSMETCPIATFPMRDFALTFLAAALVAGGFGSWFASTKPDGLEWSITRITGKEKLKGSEQGIYGSLAALQEKLSFLPDYAFRTPKDSKPSEKRQSQLAWNEQESKEKKSERSRLGKSISGIAGGTLTLVLSLLIGFALKSRNRPPERRDDVS